MSKVSVNLDFKVIVHRGEADEGGFWGEVPNLPGCYSQGGTREQLLERMKEAITCHLEALALSEKAGKRRKTPAK